MYNFSFLKSVPGQIDKLDILPKELIILWSINFLLVFKFILIYFSLIVKQAIFAYVNHALIRSWNQPVLSN